MVTEQDQNKFTVAVFDKADTEAAHTLGEGLKAAGSGGHDAGLDSAAEEARGAVVLEATLTRSGIVMCCRGWRKLLAP